MRLNFLLCMLFLQSGLILSYAEGQNYIGMDRERIIEEMKTTNRKFSLNRGVVNPHYNYLKYENSVDEITLIFFLGDDDICTLVRMICDYSNINDMLDHLNESYKSVSKGTWEEVKQGSVYTIQLTEDEWFFTITINKKD